MAAPTCRGCGAVIRWITTRSGKAMPVDPEHLQEWLIEDGFAGIGPRITLITSDGETVSGRQGSVISQGSRRVDGYVPHWSTCPKAKDFRPGGASR